jgi:hypothetical protein
MVVSGQFHAPDALRPRKEPLVPTGYEAWWVPEPVWTRWWGKNSYPLSGLETSIIQPVAQHYTTELFREKGTYFL